MKNVKPYFLLIILSTLVFRSASAQWSNISGIVFTTDQVGIGTAILSPAAGIHMQNKGGLILESNQWVNMPLLSGGESKFIWIPGTNVLRFGQVTGNQWDPANVGSWSVGFGRNVIAKGAYSFAVGNDAQATEDFATAIGLLTEANGYGSTAIGNYCKAFGVHSVAIGGNSSANADNSIALGYSISSSNYSFAVGQSSASGDYSTALGNSGTGSEYSFAAGKSSVNAGAYGTSLGLSLVDGDYSLAAGQSYTSGHHASAFGNAQGTGDFAVAGGEVAIAAGDNSIAFGSHVTVNAKYSMILGNGEKDNAFENTIDNSLMVAFNCTDLPSVFVGPADPGKEIRFGWVGIGTTTPQSEFAVNGTITCKELNADPGAGWPDYVFDKDYELMSLEEIERFVKINKHLPGVASAGEVEDQGIKVAEMIKVMMQKIEELTLHLINLKKENDQMKKAMHELKERK